jgi:hypothetical protein
MCKQRHCDGLCIFPQLHTYTNTYKVINYIHFLGINKCLSFVAEFSFIICNYVIFNTIIVLACLRATANEWQNEEFTSIKIITRDVHEMELMMKGKINMKRTCPAIVNKIMSIARNGHLALYDLWLHKRCAPAVIPKPLA